MCKKILQSTQTSVFLNIAYRFVIVTIAALNLILCFRVENYLVSTCAFASLNKNNSPNQHGRLHIRGIFCAIFLCNRKKKIEELLFCNHQKAGDNFSS